MKVQLNVTNKTITFEDGILISDINDIVTTIIGDYSGLPKYKVKIGSVPNTNLIEVRKPVNKGWDYKPVYKWLEYKGAKNVKTDKEAINNSQSFAAVLVDGVYNIDYKG
jgi:hypothetical protein